MEANVNQVWENCLAFIKDNIQSQAYKTWFEPIVPKKLSDNSLSVQVPSKFFYEWLEEHYVKLLKLSLTKELGKNCLPLCFDITDRVAVKKEIENIPPDFSKIDVLCNNAGLALGLEGADEASLDDWDKMVDTNIKGLIYATRQVLPKMVQNKSGHIINIGSVAGSYPYPGGNVYGGTKAFVSQFSLNLRADLVSKGINVTSIEPGLAETEFSLVRFKILKIYESQSKEVYSSVPRALSITLE